MAKPKADAVSKVTSSSGNLFTDLGFAPGEADVLASKSRWRWRRRGTDPW